MFLILETYAKYGPILVSETLVVDLLEFHRMCQKHVGLFSGKVVLNWAFGVSELEIS